MKLAVIGDPVAHSRSPEIHHRFLEEEGIDGSYIAVRVPKGGIFEALRVMQKDGYTGCNVTFPLKEEAFGACDVLTKEAQQIGAVNTIYFDVNGNGIPEIAGTNTDGIGARVALEDLIGHSIALYRIGVLGYGATARAILNHLSEHDAYTFVWGRDDAKIDEACKRFEAERWPHDNPPDIVVSTLPPEVPLPPELVEELRACDTIMDTNYGSRSTLGLLLHREVITGEAMLEAQARASFDYWLAREASRL